jgi:hypothetical protein
MQSTRKTILHNASSLKIQERLQLYKRAHRLTRAGCYSLPNTGPRVQMFPPQAMYLVCFQAGCLDYHVRCQAGCLVQQTGQSGLDSVPSRSQEVGRTRGQESQASDCPVVLAHGLTAAVSDACSKDARAQKTPEPLDIALAVPQPAASALASAATALMALAETGSPLALQKSHRCCCSLV